MKEEHIGLLMQAPVLRGYTVHGIKRLLASGSVKQHAVGGILFAEGDQAGEVLLVMAGRLQVYVTRHGRDVVVNHAGPGDLVGELAVLCGMPRTASVRAEADSLVLHWDTPSFRGVLLEDISLFERVLGKALRTLVNREKALVEEALRGLAPAGEAS